MSRVRNRAGLVFAGYLVLMWIIPTGIAFGCLRRFLNWPVAQSVVVAFSGWLLAVNAISAVFELVLWGREKVGGSSRANQTPIVPEEKKRRP